ncbi:carbon-nitrogen hydrolase family protein [Carboxylicivirga linearis]|uniref:CN hydrolase domain-containing protein n=1 Tax=Carboxylicivirga linearis TaxID=1628157 RepID=A0ABS5JYU2_9BACT|nr:nitrilase-related carbon-nitrogen hydrolase [Carboxylicivirga linearis]MBS2099571.1 hypothetical protein [Carboxylicivirga linearis]
MMDTAKSTMKVAAVCSWMETLAAEQNIRCIESFLQELEKQHVEYALFPELSVSGYINNTIDLDSFFSVADDAILQLKQLSKQYLLAFSVGMPMMIGNASTIAQLTFWDGNIIHQHSKTHLSVHEKEVFEFGKELELLSLNHSKIGMHLCLESHYPELSLQYQQQGANLLAFAFASPRETPEEKMERFQMMLKCRAYDNACFVMACNATGTTPTKKNYAGVSTIISPRGKVLAQYKGMEPGYCMAEIDFNDIRKIKDSLMSDFPSYRTTTLNLTFKEKIDEE